MAEYGKALPPPEPKQPLKDLSFWRVYACISIPLFIIKLIGGRFDWRYLLLLIAVALPLITVVDSLRGDGKIRVLLRGKGMTIIHKKEQPVYYWFFVVIHYALTLLFVFGCLG